MKDCCSLRCSSVDQRPLWDRVEKLQPRPGSGSSSGSSNSSSQASPSDRFRPRCESPGTVLGRTFIFFSFLKTKKPQNKLIKTLTLKIPITGQERREWSSPVSPEWVACAPVTPSWHFAVCFLSEASSKSEGSPLQRPENAARKVEEKNAARPTRPAVSPAPPDLCRSCALSPPCPPLITCSSGICCSLQTQRSLLSGNPAGRRGKTCALHVALLALWRVKKKKKKWLKLQNCSDSHDEVLIAPCWHHPSRLNHTTTSRCLWWCFFSHSGSECRHVGMQLLLCPACWPRALPTPHCYYCYDYYYYYFCYYYL